MKVKRIKKLRVNSYDFNIKWNKEHSGGSFNYTEKMIDIGVKNVPESEIFLVVCHEVMEIVSFEMNIWMRRPDCDSDYIFVYDHRQYETMMNMFSGLIQNFIQ